MDGQRPHVRGRRDCRPGDKPGGFCLDKRPTEEQIVEVWQSIFNMFSIFGKDKAVVEKAEYVEVQE